MYRNYEEQSCYMRSSRQRVMASHNREAQAIALALPQSHRNGFTSIAPASLISSLLLPIISLIILVSLVLILLGL